MSGKRKEKILYVEIQGSPVGSLYIAASMRGLISVCMGRMPEKKFIEQINWRFQDSPLFIKASSMKWTSKRITPVKLERLISSKLLKFNLIAKDEAKLPIRIIRETIQQLSDYFSGRFRKFHLKKDFSGLTDFEKSVLKELEKIPCSRTTSYQQIAERIGKPRACRAVGNAVGKNPFAIIAPCHRVIKSDGTIGGFSAPLSIKKSLLSHEKS